MVVTVPLGTSGHSHVYFRLCSPFGQGVWVKKHPPPSGIKQASHKTLGVRRCRTRVRRRNASLLFLSPKATLHLPREDEQPPRCCSGQGPGAVGSKVSGKTSGPPASLVLKQRLQPERGGVGG